MNALLEEQGKLQDQIDAADGWSLDHTLELMVTAYQRLGMEDLANDAERVRSQTFGDTALDLDRRAAK